MSIKRLPLHDVHESLGASFRESGEWLVPESYGDMQGEYEAAGSRVAIADLSDRGKLRLSGKEHLKFLQGMLTNDVMELEESKGMYAAVLTVKGRMISDMRVYRDKDSVLLDLEPGLNTKVGDLLKKYRLSYKAAIDDLTESMGLISVCGPKAPGLLGQIIGKDNLPTSEYDHVRAFVDGHEVHVVKTRRTGDEGYDIYALTEGLADVWGLLTEEGREHGIKPAGRAALDVLRIEAGIPVYGIDMDEETIPIEAGIWSALNFEKGCYVGQEVIARIRWRGHVNRHLAGFISAGAALERGADVYSGEKKIGLVTSSAFSPSLRKPVALGYIRREFKEPGTKVGIKLSDGSVGQAEVAALPFTGAGDPQKPE
ncbi:MAG: aminomethyltransferase family protein [Thermodesulfobacteriota bacterium]